MIPLRNRRRFFYKTLRQPFYAFKVFAKRIQAYFYYSSGNGRTGYPEAITLFLTHSCNLRCKMCGQWGESGVTKRMPKDSLNKRLSTDELKKVIDDVSAFRPNITLYGGEPLLYPDCANLIKYIKSKNIHCVMITNGSMLSQFAEKIIDAGLDELNISLDGDRDLHDEIRGMPGLFEKITDGLREVNRLKKKRGLKKPFVNLQCTITKYNYRHLEGIAGVAKEVGANSLTYHNLIFLGKEVIEKQRRYDELLGCSSVDWEGFVSEPGIDPDELYAKITDILKKEHPFNVDFYPNLSLKGIREYYNNPSSVPTEYPARCISPWVVAYIFPDGEVRPCLDFTYSYGNIRENRFTSIWNDKKAVDFRKMLKKEKIFPACARCTELYRY